MTTVREADSSSVARLATLLPTSRSYMTPTLVFGSVLLVAWFVVATFAPFVAPHDPLANVAGARPAHTTIAARSRCAS